MGFGVQEINHIIKINCICPLWLSAMYRIFVQEHNKLMAKMSEAFPEWNDDKLFIKMRISRRLFTRSSSRSLRRSKGYWRSVFPATSIEFSTAELRIGHTMIGNELTRCWPGMAEMDPMPMSFTSWTEKYLVSRTRNTDMSNCTRTFHFPDHV